MRSTFVIIAAVLALATLTPDEASAQKRSRDRLTNEEILASAFKDKPLLDALRALKPHFVEPPRGTRSIGGSFTQPLVIYVDGIKAPGGLLPHPIMPADIREVRYLDPTRSQNEYGITANGGALQIKLVKRGATDTTRTP